MPILRGMAFVIKGPLILASLPNDWSIMGFSVRDGP